VTCSSQRYDKAINVQLNRKRRKASGFFRVRGNGSAARQAAGSLYELLRPRDK